MTFIDEVISSWYPKHEHYKTDPKVKYCKCGYGFKFNRWDYLRMILFNSVWKLCPECHSKVKFKLVYFTVREEIKNDTSEMIWCKG